MRDETIVENAYDPADLPPEYLSYRDEGCELAPACLECPFPLCIYDDPSLARSFQAQQRGRDMALKRRAGFSVKEIAAEYDVTRRTVSRAIGEYERTQRVQKVVGADE
ncbi:MAG: helix-turn-helix domain-containing protein [Dehalogenimonas sp.]